MDALERLKSSLSKISIDSINELNLSDHSRLDAELPKLKEWVGGGSGLDAPSEDRIVSAIKAFHKNLMFEGMSQARLVSYGCTQSLGDKKYRLIEDRKRFPKLLEYVDENRAHRRPFRKCYRGLLHGYFSYDPDSDGATSEGRENWGDLRDFLADAQDSIETEGSNPEWITALNDHNNLLSDNPCKPYGLAALEGDRSAFDDIRERLEINDDSWLIRRLVNAQVDAAVELPDSKFKSVVDPLIDLLDEHLLLIDSSLSKLINRYASCREIDRQPKLRDFSVTHWRNPWLTSNAARWGSVRPDAKEMVSTWLKEQLIGQFFTLLSEDGSNDTRRVNFWKQYHDEIQDMYFALGSNAIQNQSRDFREIRKAMDGRLLRLEDASATSNAFIMMFRDFVVVEFGKSGNAAFIFKKEKLPFKLTNSVPTVGRNGLKSPDGQACDKLIHQDGIRGYARWEQRFAYEIARVIGTERTTVQIHRRNIPGTSAVPRTATAAQPRNVAPVWKGEPFSMANLHRLASEYGFNIKDSRPKGGSLWAEMHAGHFDQGARDILILWGFRWAENRGAFYKGD